MFSTTINIINIHVYSTTEAKKDAGNRAGARDEADMSRAPGTFFSTPYTIVIRSWFYFNQPPQQKDDIGQGRSLY